MTHDWMPNQNCFDVLKLARIDEKFARDQLPEFKIYWLDSNQVITSWNSKFIQHVKYKWFKNNSKSSGIISRLTDKEWAIEYSDKNTRQPNRPNKCCFYSARNYLSQPIS